MSEETKVINQDPSVNVSNILDFKSISEFEKTFAPYGKFKVKIPTPAQQIKISIAVERYLEDKGNIVDAELYNFAEAVITLENVIIEKPDNFPDIGDLYDQSFITELWSWFLDCMTEFNKKIKKNKENLIKK